MSNTMHTLPVDGMLHPLRVFLVEDSPAVRDLIIHILTDIPGITLVGFCDTENEALEQLRAHPCDVLILDIQLRQGNGISLLRTMANAAIQQKNIKIIFSNNASPAYRRSAGQYGAHFFFDKSSEFPQLCTLLEQLGTGVTVI